MIARDAQLLIEEVRAAVDIQRRRVQRLRDEEKALLGRIASSDQRQADATRESEAQRTEEQRLEGEVTLRRVAVEAARFELRQLEEEISNRQPVVREHEANASDVLRRVCAAARILGEVAISRWARDEQARLGHGVK